MGSYSYLFKKSTKVVISLLLSCLLILLACPISFANSTTISVENVSGNVGSQVDVKVNITANSGMAAGSFNLAYDPAKLSPANFGAGIIINSSYNVNLSYTSSSIRVNWAGSSSINTSGALVTIKFNILSNAATGVTNLTLNNLKLIDSSTNDITFTATNGSINISSGADTTPPTLASSDPANGATNVDIGKALTAVFSENIQAGTAYGSMTLKDSSGTPVTFTTSITAATLTATPGASLTINKQYTLTIPANAVKDMAGNGLASGVAISFTTSSTVNAKIKLDKLKSLPGKVVSINVNVQNVTSMAGVQFKLQYDPAVAVATNVKLSSFTDGFTITKNMDNAANGYILVGIGRDSGISGSGILCTVDFQVNGGVGTKTPVTVSDLVVKNDSIPPRDIPMNLEDGEVNVGVIYGDVSGDGIVDIGDAILIMKYVVRSITKFPIDN